MIEIRAATEADHDRVWAMLEPVIREGETHPMPRDMGRADLLAYWFKPENEVFMALDGGKPVGTYHIHANHIGLGSHVANCGYVTDAAARGRGVGRAMGEHSLAHAKARGFRAMQFNLVVKPNVASWKLWQKLGFEIVGTLPGAFLHAREGYVDAYVMYRTL